MWILHDVPKPKKLMVGGGGERTSATTTTAPAACQKQARPRSYKERTAVKTKQPQRPSPDEKMKVAKKKHNKHTATSTPQQAHRNKPTHSTHASRAVLLLPLLLRRSRAHKSLTTYCHGQAYLTHHPHRIVGRDMQHHRLTD